MTHDELLQAFDKIRPSMEERINAGIASLVDLHRELAEIREILMKQAGYGKASVNIVIEQKHEESEY